MPKFGGDADVIERLDHLIELHHRRYERPSWRKRVTIASRRKACIELVNRLFIFDARRDLLIPRSPDVTAHTMADIVDQIAVEGH